jgi:hypothetical protein
MPRIDQLVKLAEAAGCTLRLGDNYTLTGQIAHAHLELGRRQIYFTARGPWNWEGGGARVVKAMRIVTETCVAELREWRKASDVTLTYLGSYNHSEKAAYVIARFFADVRAADGGRSVTFDIQGYGRGTPTVTLRSVWDGGRYVIEYVGRDKRVVRDPEGISLAYFRGDIEAGMFLDWLWDEVKL